MFIENKQPPSTPHVRLKKRRRQRQKAAVGSPSERQPDQAILAGMFIRADRQSVLRQRYTIYDFTFTIYDPD